MHRIPAASAGRRTIDEERVCEAISGIGDRLRVDDWAGRFAVLGDRGRLTLLLSIHHAGPISVSDLAVAADMTDTAVSQALRLLRAAGLVLARREGRIVRYELADPRLGEVLELVTPAALVERHHAVRP
jgi:DNA-binding transcriptional ArsR family regulator